MYRIKEIIENGFIIVDEDTGVEEEYKTGLPFRPGDRITNLDGAVKMVDMFESLLAQQVLRLAPLGSPEYEDAKSVLIRNKENPKFLEGDTLIEFLANRVAISKATNV